MFSICFKVLCTCSLSCALMTNNALTVPNHTLSYVAQRGTSVSSSNYEQTRLSLLLGDKGYSLPEIDILHAHLSPDCMESLLNRPYDELIVKIAAQPHFHESQLDQYLDYGHANPQYSPEDLVTRVNMGMDDPFYHNPQLIQNPESIDVLVNKYYTLGADYVPELVKMAPAYANSSNSYMHPEAYAWFVKMADAARAQGLQLRSVSAYRSYASQKSIYQRYVNEYGTSSADIYSARPGHSEHQTGLAVDINVARRTAHFENTQHYQWLSENSWKYGFILRYPQNKRSITGFIFEPWHYRYVGLELAKAVSESGLTLEEYLASRPAAQSVS